MFIILVVIFVGYYLWVDFIWNIILVYLGNVVGGVVFVSLFYFFVYKKNVFKKVKEEIY